jgi:hypothetical protein
MIYFTAFRPFGNTLLTEKYIDGHKKVLEVYGVTKVTSMDTSWVDDPNTVVIHVESETGKVLGGGRIQVTGQHPLPIEGAVGEIDDRIYGIIESHALTSTGEFCGLWNSREIAGYGIGSVFLGRVGISLISQLRLGSLFALCSPATLKPCLNIGFRVFKEIGNEGTFYYPKEDLVATCLIVPDPSELSHASEEDRKRIISLRENPIQIVSELGPRGPIEISYNLAL